MEAGIASPGDRPYTASPGGTNVNRFNAETMKKLHGNLVSFHQGCPVCGRLLNIGVTLLGKRVYCQHCGGGFIAADPSAGPAVGDRRVEDLLERAEAALQQAAESTDSDVGWAAAE